MKCPADIYKPSLKRYPDRLPEPTYPNHDLVRQVYASGSVCFREGKSFFISTALADQTIHDRVRFYARFELLIIDEFGLDRIERSLLRPAGITDALFTRQ